MRYNLTNVISRGGCINIPAIASRTYTRLKQEAHYSSLVQTFADKLKEIKSLFERVKFFHQKVDEAVNKVLSNEFVSPRISCRPGCAHCCYTQVSVTQDEAEILASRIIANADEFDMGRLLVQAQALNSADKWYGLSCAKRRCLFLNDDNLCSVYEDRPAVCRANYVLSAKESCSTEDGQEHHVRLLSTADADMIIVGAFVHSAENGALPFMLWRAINKLKNQR